VREGVKMRRCEDEKMRYRPPLLEEPCAQTLSGKKKCSLGLGIDQDTGAVGCKVAMFRGDQWRTMVN